MRSRATGYRCGTVTREEHAMPQQAWSDKRERQLDKVKGSLRDQKRSGHGPGGRTRDQLYAEATRRGVEGRSKMTKAQLEKAVDR
jgi:hypothetical protein